MNSWKEVKCAYCGEPIGCPYCGQILPNLKIVSEEGNFFCNAEHRDKWKEQKKNR